MIWGTFFVWVLAAFIGSMLSTLVTAAVLSIFKEEDHGTNTSSR